MSTVKKSIEKYWCDELLVSGCSKRLQIFENDQTEHCSKALSNVGIFSEEQVPHVFVN